MRPTARLGVNLSWLRDLKGDPLRRIAQSTGISNGGTKPTLINSLQTHLPITSYKRANLPTLTVTADGTAGMNSRNEDLSVISIDMGLLNLAYAHFTVPADLALRVDSPSKPTPTLNAWKRLSILDMIDSTSKKMMSTSRNAPIDERRDHRYLLGKVPPQTYAAYAYSIADDLVKRFQPTHVLIERQRLRSSGSPNVYETVLRVSSFESMLHAALAAIARERGVRIEVQAVDPKSVVSTIYAGLAWEEGRDRSRGGGAAVNDLRSKKRRVDIVGGVLGAWAMREGLVDVQDGGVLEEGGNSSGASMHVAADQDLRGVALGYLDQWQRSVSRRRRNPTGASPAERKFVSLSKQAGMEDVCKLDDLADCLVQGMVWLEWQVMRDLFCRQGEAALPWIRHGWVTD